MVKSRQKCAKFRVRWKGPYEVMQRLSDLNYLVKLSKTKEIVVNVNKMKKCFRQTALRPTTKQRSTRNRAEDKLETLETYWTRYTRPDSQTLLSDATEKDMTENLTQDPDFDPYHHSSTRNSSCDVTNVPEIDSRARKYPIGNQTGEYHREVDDIPQVSEGEGGTMSEQLCTELVDPGPTPKDPLEVEGVTDASEKAESTPRYNLRPRPGRKPFIFLLMFFNSSQYCCLRVIQKSCNSMYTS
jgi:hypothetical protein